MKEVKIYGVARSIYKDTKHIVQDVIRRNSIKAKLIKIEDINEILKEDIFTIPAVAVDGKIISEGSCPTRVFLENALMG